MERGPSSCSTPSLLPILSLSPPESPIQTFVLLVYLSARLFPQKRTIIVVSISEQCCFLSPCREELCFQDSFTDFSANESIFPTTVCSNKIFCLMLEHRRIGSAFLLMNFSIKKGSSQGLLAHLLKTVLIQRKDKVEV